MTLDDAADFLKVSSTTIYQLVRAGEVPARKVGREWRFLKSQLVAYLKQGGDSMTYSSVMTDEQGGEYKIENGQEYVALWLPFSREEKADHIRKAVEQGTTVSALVATYLKETL
ncbi:helix-turn-helix domain-containing protein [Deinococcus hohokamensis]|uniref:Helix-turn-helix domain-containing protein n=1 Tax=Deinococcus hohokamensis TaxID=309883 RepID=A0ABV9I664_9DEIO